MSHLTHFESAWPAASSWPIDMISGTPDDPSLLKKTNYQVLNKYSTTQNHLPIDQVG